jgi:predicted membrane channel-forming protein YqfA (hemolysin III family)
VIQRLLRRVRGQAPFLVVLAVMVAALVYLQIWPDHWRRGVAGLAASMALAGVLRIVLPRHRAGLLAVRARWFDSVAYLLLGATMLVATVQLG